MGDTECSMQSRQDGVHCEADREQGSRMKGRHSTLPELGRPKEEADEMNRG